MCTLLWKIMTWCHFFPDNCKGHHIPGCLNVMADLLSRSNQVQSTEWSQHPLVFKQNCQKWFTPNVVLFAIRQYHRVPLYISLVQDQRAQDIDALNINWLGLMLLLTLSRLSHRHDPKNQAKKLPHHSNSPRLARDALVLGPLPKVQLSTEIPLQLPVSTTLLKQSHNQVFHNNPQHLNLHAWCLGVDSSKNKTSLWKWQREFLLLKGHQQGPSTSQSGPYLKNGAEINHPRKEKKRRVGALVFRSLNSMV